MEWGMGLGEEGRGVGGMGWMVGWMESQPSLSRLTHTPRVRSKCTDILAYTYTCTRSHQHLQAVEKQELVDALVRHDLGMPQPQPGGWGGHLCIYIFYIPWIYIDIYIYIYFPAPAR